MQIRSSSLLAIVPAALAWHATAQVLSPAEIADPAIRALQQSHLAELHAITAALAGHQFPYHFYFSRKLDLSERSRSATIGARFNSTDFKGRSF